MGRGSRGIAGQIPSKVGGGGWRICFALFCQRRASADLDAIFRYIEKDSPQNAVSVIEELLDAIDSLEQLPHRYRVLEGEPRARSQTRVMPVSPFLVYYRVLDDQRAVRLITVRHGARRQPRRFR